MKVLLGHLDLGMDTKDPHSNLGDKTFLGLCIVSNVCKRSKLLLKWGKNFSQWLLYHQGKKQKYEYMIP